MFLTLDGAGTARVWEPPTAYEKVTLGDGNERLSRPVLSADGKTAFAIMGDQSPRVTRWSLARDDSVQFAFKELTQFKSVRPLAVSSDGKAVVVCQGSMGNETWLISVTDKQTQTVHSLLHSGEVNVALFRSDGPEVLTWDHSGAARLWNSDTGRPIGKSIPFPGTPTSFAIRPDGKSVVLGGTGTDKTGLAQVWSLEEKGSRLSPPLHHAGPVIEVSFDSGGTAIRTRDSRHSVFRWEIDSGHPIEVSPLPENSRLVALAPSGDRHVVAGADGVPKLYVGGDRAFVTLSAPPPAEWRTARFSSDGRMLLTTWTDGVRLFDARTSVALGPLLPFANPDDAAFAGTDNRQIMAWHGTEARLWRLQASVLGRADDWKLWLSARTALTRDGDGPFRFLDARSWKQIRNEWEARKKILDGKP